MASDMNDYFNKKKSEGGGQKKSSGGGNGPTVPQMPKMPDFGGKSGIVYFLIAVVV
ncbi:MAG TPA: prohibitin family protein, partial [Sulfurimonas sp.]|nr:prohibitin family protein [Sulfurimonas sp.]